MSSWLQETLLIERLAGVFLYTIILVWAYTRIKNNISPKKTLKVYLAILTVMAFFYVPGEQADLTRLFEIGNVSWEGIPFLSFLKNIALKSSTPLGDLIIYIFTRTPFDGILPAFCAFVFYFNVFSIFQNLLKRENIPKKNIALALLLFMAAGSFLEVISDVRCFVAFSIVARIIYFEIVNQQMRLLDFVGFVVACLIHSTSIPLVILWLIVRLFTHSSKRRITFFRDSILLFGFGIAVMLFGNRYILSSINKATHFFNNDIYSYFWEYLIGIIQVVAFLFILYEYKRGNCISHSMSDLFNFSIVLIIFILCFSWEYNIFHRFILPLSIFMIPLLALVEINGPAKFRIFGTSIKRQVFYCAMLILFLACARGNLCGYKFFVWR